MSDSLIRLSDKPGPHTQRAGILRFVGGSETMPLVDTGWIFFSWYARIFKSCPTAQNFLTGEYSRSRRRSPRWEICVPERCRCNTTSAATRHAAAKPTRRSSMAPTLKSASPGTGRAVRSLYVRRMSRKSASNWKTTIASAIWSTSGSVWRWSCRDCGSASAGKQLCRRKKPKNHKIPTKSQATPSEIERDDGVNCCRCNYF